MKNKKYKKRYPKLESGNLFEKEKINFPLKKMPTDKIKGTTSIQKNLELIGGISIVIDAAKTITTINQVQSENTL